MADSTYEIRIQTSAQLRAAQETQRALENAVKVTKQLGGDSRNLERQLDGVNRALKSQSAAAVQSAASLRQSIAAVKSVGGNTSEMRAQLASIQRQHGVRLDSPLQRGLSSFQELTAGVPGLGGISSMAGRLATTGGGLMVGGAGLLGIGVKSVKEFSQAQDVIAQFDAALAQSGNLTDAYREKLHELASQLQATTAVADEDWLAVMKRLTQFGASPENMEKYLEAVKNLAGIMGGDVQTAAMIFSRAMQGNFTMLSRYGIKVDEGASKTEKLNQLMELAARRGAGQLEAKSKTLSGQWQLLKLNISDLFEAIGLWMNRSGVMQSVLYGLAKSAEWAAKAIGGVTPVVEGLTNAQEKTVVAGEDAADAADEHAEAVKRVGDAAKEASEQLEDELKAMKDIHDFEDKLADAEMALALAKLEARTDLSKTEKLKTEQGIREAARLRKVEREIQHEKDVQAKREAAAQEAERKREEASVAETTQRNVVTGLEQMEASREDFKRAKAIADSKKQAAAEAAKEAESLEMDAVVARGRIIAMGGTPKGKSQEMVAAEAARLRADTLAGESESASREAASAQERMLFFNAGSPYAGLKLSDERAKLSQLTSTRKALEDEAAFLRSKADQDESARAEGERRTRELSGLTGQTGLISSLSARQAAQTGEIIEPLPAGTAVTEAASRIYQQLAENNVRVAAALNRLATSDAQTAQAIIVAIESVLAQNDRLRKGLSIQGRRAANERTP